MAFLPLPTTLTMFHVLPWGLAALYSPLLIHLLQLSCCNLANETEWTDSCTGLSARCSQPSPYPSALPVHTKRIRSSGCKCTQQMLQQQMLQNCGLFSDTVYHDPLSIPLVFQNVGAWLKKRKIHIHSIESSVDGSMAEVFIQLKKREKKEAFVQNKMQSCSC